MSATKQIPWHYERHHVQCADILMADAHLRMKQKDYAKAIERLEQAIWHLKQIVAERA
jgi:hypothetical protein